MTQAMMWVVCHPDVDLGLLPEMLDLDDPDGAVKQFDKNYQHGGGWMRIDGFTMTDDLTIKYPGDPPLTPLAATTLRKETIVLYPHDLVAVIQPDWSFEISRMD